MNPYRLLPFLTLSLWLIGCGFFGTNTEDSKAIVLNLEPYKQLINSPWNSFWSTENSIQVSMPSIPASLNPFWNITSSGLAIQGQIHGCLWKTNPLTGLPEPDLVTNVQFTTKAPRIVQLCISQDRYFENGSNSTLCKAADVAFSLKAFALPGFAHPAYENALEFIQELSILNDSTVHIRFSGSDSACIQNLCDLPILRESEWDPQFALRTFTWTGKNGPNLEQTGLKSTENISSPGKGLGHYALDFFQPSQHVRLFKHGKNGSKSGPDTLNYVWLGDATGLENHLKYQRADLFSYLTHQDYRSFTTNPDIAQHYHLTAIQTETLNFLAFNTRPEETKAHPILADRRVRLAISQLTPVETILKKVFELPAQPMSIMGHLGPGQAYAKPAHSYTLHQGKASLGKLGWKDSDANGILDKTIEGKKVELKLRIIYNSTSRVSEDLMAVLEAEWLKCGIGLEKQGVAAAAFFDAIQNRSYDIVLSSFSGKPSAAHIKEIWHSENWTNGGHNYTGFGSDSSDAWLEQMASSSSIAQRRECLLKLQDLILQESPWIPLYFSQRYVATHKRWHNMVVLASPPGFFIGNARLGIQTSP